MRAFARTMEFATSRDIPPTLPLRARAGSDPCLRWLVLLCFRSSIRLQLRRLQLRDVLLVLVHCGSLLVRPHELRHLGVLVQSAVQVLSHRQLRVPLQLQVLL